ncbi:high affinity immunoglobulin gamma Fc receptor I-like isoform X2 [Anabas testudineus]|uniref:high affinity immunoglobulin gamma Fc receptor I-like isoform X2 n=1 Tax=Anabas testudineus TaxID=64144 RepID=UPI000E45B064|nr:high affinity immunoglobulin gamma Fc receptor I-like isoform X2 [Anabas testudineus]
MEVAALCFRLAFLRITPNRLQHFELDSVSFECVGFDGLTHLKAVRNTEELNLACDNNRTTSSCTIDRVYLEDSGEYWCESEGERSDRVNITITDGPVILDSPVLPVMQRTNVILRCGSKNPSSNLGMFYKNDVPMHNTPAEEIKINNISKSHEGFYKCHVSSIGTSPASWLAVEEFSVTSTRPHEDLLSDDSNSLSVPILLRIAVTIFITLLLLVGLSKLKISACW